MKNLIQRVLESTMPVRSTSSTTTGNDEGNLDTDEIRFQSYEEKVWQKGCPSYYLLVTRGETRATSGN